MAVTAKDGSRHHSSSRASLHDEMSASKASAGKVAEMKPAGDSYPAPSSHSIEDHVDEHGPAHKIEYKHDQATNEHHVSSHHGDGEETSHHSKHKTHHAAHEHMAKAMGMTKEEEQEDRDNESPDEEMQEETAPAGKGIPGLS
jgi:hypothetical protein